MRVCVLSEAPLHSRGSRGVGERNEIESRKFPAHSPSLAAAEYETSRSETFSLSFSHAPTRNGWSKKDDSQQLGQSANRETSRMKEVRHGGKRDSGPRMNETNAGEENGDVASLQDAMCERAVLSRRREVRTGPSKNRDERGESRPCRRGGGQEEQGGNIRGLGRGYGKGK